MKSTEKTVPEKGSVSITLHKSDQQTDSKGSEKDTKNPESSVPKKKALEPTRYGDWEMAGRCIDF